MIINHIRNFISTPIVSVIVIISTLVEVGLSTWHNRNIIEGEVNPPEIKYAKLIHRHCDGDCSICRERMSGDGDEDLYELPCRHKFHKKCISEWAQEKDQYGVAFTTNIVIDGREYTFNNRTPSQKFPICPLCRKPFMLRRTVNIL